MFHRHQSRVSKARGSRFLRLGLAVATLIAASGLATGATLCVNPGGKGGCYSSITDAVSNANANDTINVAPGTYHENVVINKSLALIGAGAQNTIIDAAGLSNGINVDGHNNVGLVNHTLVTGFTTRNANFEGILITDASSVTVANNIVVGNDKSLDPSGPACPGLPPYFAGPFLEGRDCGEGIHLSGVDHSTIANNTVVNNSGGILLTDETGPTHDNLLTGNTVQKNAFDCGITLAAHIAFGLGISHNTIAANNSSFNGLAVGEGAGVGIFAGPPGAKNYGNVVVNNVLTNNGLPGVTMHSHSPSQNLNDNQIVGNHISGNAADADAPTSGPTGIVIFSDSTAGAGPITGMVISQNVIKGEAIDIAVATNGGSVDAHFNSLLGGIGVQNQGSASVDATANWWKCSGGPDANGCSTVQGAVDYTPWLTHPFNPESPE